MKKIALIAMIFVFVAMMIGIGCVISDKQVKVDEPPISNVKYAGLINPIDVVESWTYIASSSMGGAPFFCYKNPDKDGEVKYATIHTSFMGVFAYSYLHDGVIHGYFSKDGNVFKIIEGMDQKNWKTTYELFFDINFS